MFVLHSLFVLAVATEPTPTPTSIPTPAVEEPTPSEPPASDLPLPVQDPDPTLPTDPAEGTAAPAESAPSPAAPVTIQTQDGTRVVDLEDETSWEGLSSATKDKLRAERARRQTTTETNTESTGLDADVPRRETERPPLRSAPASRTNGELEEYYEDKERQLVITTAVLGGLWGVLTLTSIGLLSSGKGTPALNGAIGVFTAASGLGTIVSGTLLGAHRNTRPLYFTAGRGGIGLRF